MAVEYASRFHGYVDELFSSESRKSLITHNGFDFSGGHSVRIYKVSTAPMENYSRSKPADGNWSRYGNVAGLNATTEFYNMHHDRSFTFVIDRMDEDETMGALQAATALARQIREVIIPEVDTWTFGKISTNAGTTPAPMVLTPENIYSEIIAGTTVLDDAEVPDAGRALVVTPAVYQMLKQSPEVMLNTDVSSEMRLRGTIAMLDGLTVVRPPSKRLAKNFGFLITHPSTAIAPSKLESFRIHQDPPGISGSLVEGRIVYDAYVLENKKQGIYFQTIPL